MIIPTVLGCVAVAFTWMLQYQNGGLLNVIMKPVRSPGSPNITFEVVSDFSGLSTQVMNIVWGRLTVADLAVLEALPADLGGGEQGVNQAIAHPNNEGKLIVAFIVCLVFASLGLVAIFVVSLVCCCCCSSSSNDSSNNDQNFLCCGLHILGFVMTALLLVGLAVCIGYYFGAANVVSETLANSEATDAEVIVWLRGNSSSFSIGRIMEFLVSNVGQFASTSIQSAKTNVNMTINNLTKHLLEGALPNEISTLVTAIAVEFKVAEIIQEANKMVYAIGNATENSDFISTNHTSIVFDIVKNAKLLNTTLDSVTSKCGTDSPQAATKLKNDFDPSKVLLVPRNVTETLKKTYMQLHKLQSQLENVTKQLETMQQDVVDELQKKLDFQKMLGSMNDLMDGLDKQVVQVIEQLNNVTTKVSGYLEEYSGTAKAALYALCLPCLLAGILFLVFLALYLFGALKRHLFSLTGNSAAEARGTWSSGSSVRGGGMFCVCSALLLVPIILIGLVAVVTVTVGGFMHAEVCPYIANDSGIRMTDYVVNSQVQVMWDNLITTQLPGGGTTGGNELAGILNLKAPQNPLHAIEIGCDPQNAGPTSEAGLLAQMGIENLVNISALLENPILTKGIQEAKANLVKAVVAAKLGDVIPDEIISNIKNLPSILEPLVAFLNKSDSAKHLEEHLFKTEKIRAFAESLNSKCDNISTQLKLLLPDLEKTNISSDNLRKAYNGLSGNLMLNTTPLVTGLTFFINLTTNETGVSQALDEPLDNFTTALLTTVNETGTDAFGNLTQSLLPCGSLHNAVHSVVFMGCGASGMAPRLFAWGLFLSLCLFFTFFSLLSLCLLWRVQNHQAKRFGGSDYSDKEDENGSEY